MTHHLTTASTTSRIARIALTGSLDPHQPDTERQALGMASDAIWSQAEDHLVAAIRAGEFEGLPDELTIQAVVAEQLILTESIQFL